MAERIARLSPGVDLHPRAAARARAVAAVVLGATLWGLSGTAAQQLMQVYGVQPGWLVTTRMIASGLVLLAATRLLAPGTNPWEIWRDPRARVQLVVFALGGLLGVQYSYMASIALGNAATATFLQYLGPVVVTAYEVVLLRRRPRPRESLSLLLAVVGTLLLATGGALDRLAVPAGAVAWGLFSAVTLAFYTLSGAGLMRRWNAVVVIGWAMLIGGAGFTPLAPVWDPAGARWNAASLLLLAFVVVGGTLLAFTLYLTSLRHLPASQTSMLACTEPLAAAASATLLLHVPFTAATAAGGACILATVALLAGGREGEAG